MTDIAVRDEPFGITCALFFRSSALFMLILVATFLPVCLSYLAGEIHHYTGNCASLFYWLLFWGRQGKASVIVPTLLYTFVRGTDS